MEDADERQASESACGCSTLASKPHYKAFKFIDKSQETEGLEGEKRTTLELHRQNGEAGARNQPGVDSWVNAARHDGAEYPTNTSLGELEESKGRRKIHIKNNFMDSDMPEMVAFFQGSSYHFVKDIFMDGEVDYKKENNCCVENCQLDHSSISSILNFDVESSSASTIGTQDSVPSISKDSKFVADDDFHDLLIDQRGLKMSMKDFDGEEDVFAAEMNVHGSRWVKEVPSKDAELPNSIVLSTSEAVYNDYPTSTAASFRSEEGNIISNTEADCEQAIEIKTTPTNSRDQSFRNENVQGESTSFAVEHPPPGLTKNSVPQLFCGSVSLASSGSTASSHSFAFPILPSEWAGSPERMPSSDQRQLQRHQRWRIRFLCCKF